MQQLVQSGPRLSVLARKAMHSPRARKAYAAAVPMVLMVASQALAAEGEITQADFTGLATKVLTYLGYAIAAGLTVLVAVIAARAGWQFFGKFIKA